MRTNRRGETLYGADSKIPLHPPVLSEGAASLLPDQVRPALLWTIQVDEVGEGVDVQVERALVRSRAQLSYEAVQADSNSAQAWAARGAAYERLGDKAKAFTSYGRALALRPSDEAARSGDQVRGRLRGIVARRAESAEVMYRARKAARV